FSNDRFELSLNAPLSIAHSGDIGNREVTRPFRGGVLLGFTWNKPFAPAEAWSPGVSTEPGPYNLDSSLLGTSSTRRWKDTYSLDGELGLFRNLSLSPGDDAPALSSWTLLMGVGITKEPVEGRQWTFGIEGTLEFGAGKRPIGAVFFILGFGAGLNRPSGPVGFTVRR